jgi:Kef-type K+ transport system membrane component KefB
MTDAFPITDPVFQFTLLAAVVLVIQLSLEKMHVPAIVGLLVVGMLLGPGGIQLLPREPVVELLGSIGLIYIMFMAGLEIDLDIVRSHKLESISFGLLAFVLTLVPALAVGLLLDFGWAGALLIGAAVSSHTLLAYPIIENLRLLHSQPVVATVGGTLLTDTLALVLLVVVLQTAENGKGPFDSWYMPLLALAALVAASLVVLPRLSRWFLGRKGIARAEAALAVLVVLLVLSSTADLIGTEQILGAFLAGVCLNQPLKQREALLEHLQFAGRMLFIPFFFVETGMRLELEVLFGGGDAWMVAGLLLLVLVVGKSAAAWGTGWWFGYRPVARVVMGSMGLPQAAATLAVTVTASEAGLLDETAVDAAIIVIFLTSLTGPLITRYAGRRLAVEESKGAGNRHGNAHGGAQR